MSRSASSLHVERAVLASCIIASLAGCAHLSARDKESAEIHNDLGASAFQGGRYQEAMQEFQTSIQMNPNFALPHEGLGVVYLYYWTGPRVEDAKQEFQKAVKIDPHYADAWNNLGTIYADQGDLPHAQEAFEKALGEPFYKTPWIAQTNLGWVIHLEGHTEQGKMLIKQALVNTPNYCVAHRQLARILADEGDSAAAEEHWEAFAKYCPKNPEAAFHEAAILMKRGQDLEARPWLQTCIKAGGSLSFVADCRNVMATLPPPDPVAVTDPNQGTTLDAPATSQSNNPVTGDSPR
jgi:type IV pilus biogenesis/stability protein PilW